MSRAAGYSLLSIGGPNTDVNGPTSTASFMAPLGIIVDAAANIYVTDKGTYQVRKIIQQPYFIDKPLPPGLVFDPVTGTISGTPGAISPATDYTITGYNIFGSKSAVVNIEVKQPVVFTFAALPVKTICDRDFDPGAVTNTGPIFYGSSNTAVATMIGAQLHIVGPGTTTISANNLGVTLTQTLTVSNPPKATFNGNVVITNGAGKQLLPVISGNVTGYTWMPAVGLSNPAVANPVANPAVTTTYHLQLTSADGCSGPPDSVVVQVATTIIIPNAFTPNGDGINDLWNIASLNDYPQSILTIYNRYGSLVYHSVGYSKPWDGLYNGKQLPVGTYYYVIDLKNNKPVLSGRVTIIR